MGSGTQDQPAGASGTLTGGYVPVTANQTSLGAGPTDLTSLTATVTVGAGRRIRITGSVTLTAGTLASVCTLGINEGATVLNTSPEYSGIAAGNAGCVCQVILTPTAGSHTYKLTAAFSANANNLLTASATAPAFILVEDIGT